MMPYQSFLAHRYVTLGWMFMPALVTNYIQLFDLPPYGLVIFFSIICIGVTLREYPWKKLMPIKTPAFEAESDEESELFQVPFRSVRYGLIIQYIGIAGLLMDTIAAVAISLYNASGWSLLLVSIHSFLYVALLVIFTMLTCVSPIHKAFIPDVKARSRY